MITSRSPAKSGMVHRPVKVKEMVKLVLQQPKEAALDRICVKTKGRIIFLDPDEIRWVEAAGNYLKLHTEVEAYAVRGTMVEFATRLNPDRFLRIHRSIIVNTLYIRELKPWYTGEYILVLSDGKELTVSRGYRSSIEQITAKGGCAKRNERAVAVLAIKDHCEKCSAPLVGNTAAFVCTHGCTFCQDCTEVLHYVCPNCSGELTYRETK